MEDNGCGPDKKPLPVVPVVTSPVKRPRAVRPPVVPIMTPGRTLVWPPLPMLNQCLLMPDLAACHSQPTLSRGTHAEDKEVAKDVNQLMLDFGAKLNRSITLAKERCNESEFKAYRLAVGKILGEMLMEVMNPLHAEHPDLKPEEMR